MTEDEAVEWARKIAPTTALDVALFALERPDCAKVEFYPDGGIRAIEFRAPARDEAKAKGRAKVIPIAGEAGEPVTEPGAA